MPELKPKNQGRIDCIEMLRGFAILFVVLHHLKGGLITPAHPVLIRFYNYFNGTGGVDLFFAISGFVIARSLVRQLAATSGQGAFWRVTVAFWARRVGRLLPTAWLWLAIILACAVFYNESGVFGSVETNLGATLAGILNTANFRFADAFGRYFYGASFVYWSLSLEWQFYFLFPLAVLIFRRRLPYALAPLVLLQLFSHRSLLLMMIRTDAILLGVLLALWSHTRSYGKVDPGRLKNPHAVTLALSIVLLAALATVTSKAFKPDVPYPMGMVAILSFLLVWLGSYNRGYVMPVAQLKTIFCWVGSRSYGIYVIHIPVFYLVRETWQRMGVQHPHPIISVAAAVAAILIISELNYRCVERPLRKRGAIIAGKILSGMQADAGHGTETNNPTGTANRDMPERTSKTSWQEAP